MKGISIPIIAAGLLAVATSAYSADDFTAACMLDAKAGTDMAKTCACMSGKIPDAERADAAEALRRSNQAAASATPVHPSTLPPNLMKGLQAAVLAQSECRE